MLAATGKPKGAGAPGEPPECHSDQRPSFALTGRVLPLKIVNEGPARTAPPLLPPRLPRLYR